MVALCPVVTPKLLEARKVIEIHISKKADGMA